MKFWKIHPPKSIGEVMSAGAFLLVRYLSDGGMFENSDAVYVVSTEYFSFFLILFWNNGDNMTESARNRAIKKLNKYIWTLKHQCESVTQINAELIMQYCRFVVLSEEVSIEITNGIGKMATAELEDKIKIYERINKLTLNLYKVLKFDEIKDELADYGNPFTKVFNEAKDDGDF